MNKSIEHDSPASTGKRKRAPIHPSNWSIKWKARLNFFLRAVVAIGLLVFAVNLLQRRMIIRNANDKLLLMSQEKSRYVEDYFNHLSRQLTSFVAERSTLEAFNQLTGAFLSIESDNFQTSAAGDMERINTLLEGFYATEILPVLDDGDNASAGASTLLPADNKQRILQYHYLAANPKPLGSKGVLAKAEDGSSYSYMHSMYHPRLLKFSRINEISDILFVDYSSGYVTYSVSKNLDFATNLYSGPYKNSGLGMAFKRVISHQQAGYVGFTDVSVYLPSFYQPCMFLSAPIHSGTQLVGAVIFAVDTRVLNNLLAFENTELSAGKTLKSIIVGHDYYYRNDDPAFLADAKAYVRKLKRHAGKGETAALADKYKSTAMAQSVDKEVLSGIARGKEDIVKYTTETGVVAQGYFKPLQVDDLKWTLLTQMDKSEVMAPARRLSLTLFVITLLIALVLYYMSAVINNYIASRLGLLRDGLISLSRGRKIEKPGIDTTDEIGQLGGALESLADRLDAATNYIDELSRGNIDVDYTAINEEDRFGIALKSLRNSLIANRDAENKRKHEDEIRNWANNGIAMFNDILRTNNNDLEKLSQNIIQKIIEYLSANQGGLFLIEEEDQQKFLNLQASYAYDRLKYQKKRIAVGEGLAGTCVLEKKSILTNRIPDNYITIGSGLGESKPRCLLIVPLKKDEDVLGVLEIASFDDFRPHEVEFVEKIAESIASALITVKLHLQTSQYLERFQQQAEEMKAQDEELRQNIEELQATHEQMERLKQEDNERHEKLIKEMEDYRKLLISVLNEVPEKIYLKDDKGRFIIANKPVADNYKRTVDEILGKSDFDFYPREEAMEYFNHEQDIIKAGKTQVFEEGDPSKMDGLIVRSMKKPFYIEHLGVTGIMGVQFDISDIKRKEFESNKMAQELQEKQAMIDASSKELEKEKALLDALLNNVPEHIYFKDIESRFIRFSKSMLSLFGLTKPEELTGKSDFDFFSEEHSRPAYEGEQKIIKTGEAIIDLEEKNVLANGDVSWVNTTKMPLRNAEGKIIGTFGISKDITRIKTLQEEATQTAEELKSQEEEMRQNMEEMLATQEDMRRQMEENNRIQKALGDEKALMDELLINLPEHIYFKDKESRFIRFSHSMLKLFGLEKPEELIGKSDFDFFSEEHARPAFEDEQRIIKTGKAIIDIEEKEVMPDGRIRWVNTTKMPLKNGKGEIMGTFGISKNITHMKKLEEEAIEKAQKLMEKEDYLKKNQQLMIDILDEIPAKIFLKDEEGRFVIANSAVAAVYNKKANQVIGTTDYDNHPGEDVDSWRKQEVEIMKKGKKTYMHTEVSGGIKRHLKTVKMPFKVATTGKTGLLGMQFDVTDMKMLEDKLEEMKRKGK